MNNEQKIKLLNNTQQILFYTDLICEKIDLHADAFIQRIGALKAGDKNKVEYIEKMMLEPLDQQLRYLLKKVSELPM